MEKVNTCSECGKPFYTPTSFVERRIFPQGPWEAAVNSTLEAIHVECLDQEDKETLLRPQAIKRILPVSLVIATLAGWGSTKLASQLRYKVPLGGVGFVGGGIVCSGVSGHSLKAWYDSHYPQSSEPPAQ